jgi:DNA-directed RNA polymerase subunit RPC12/RpoP
MSPLRTYLCPVCNETFELVLNREKFNSTPVTRCPECDTPSPAIPLETPARRAPYHGLQG